MDDDFFDDNFDDAALAAALDAAERSKSKTAAAVQPPPARPQATGARNIPTPVLIRNDQSCSGAGASSSSTTAATTPGGGVKQPVPTAVKQPEPRRIAKPIGFSSIIVSTRQKGNPILLHIKQVPWEYGDIVPDYVMGASACALFLSLKYHRLHPEYIYNRIKALGHSYSLRVLLILCDTPQHADPLAELTKTAFAHNLTVIVSWSAEEAGGYIEAYKRFEHTPPTHIRERAKTEWMDQVVEFATVVPGVNKTDAYGLISMFGTVKDAMNATPEQLSMIPGWGQKKVERWTKAMKEPLNPGKEEEEERREQLQRFAKAAGGSGSSGGRTKEDDNQAIINARLGIASVRLGKRAEERIREYAEIDEDELIAAAEAEAAEDAWRIRNATTMAASSSNTSGPASSATAPAASSTASTASGAAPASSSGNTDGVMAALAKLRQT